MAYQPFLIANFATGLNTRLQPWLIPDDAQEELFDGYVYRGTQAKRDGYNYYAIGQKGGYPYRESRIVTTTAPTAMTGAIDGVNQTFTYAGPIQLARGSVTVSGSNPVQTFTDDGLGEFYDGLTPIGTVDYLTGAISITLPVAPIVASTVTVTFSSMPGNPVMMVANFITASNIKELIVADTQYVNKYDSTNNILVDISPASPYTGNNHDFFTWVNYPDASNNPRLLFCNNKDVIQAYNGTTVADYVYTSGTITTLVASYMVQMKDRLILLRTTENGTIYPQRIRISGTGANCDVFDTSATGAGFIDIPDGTWINGASFNRDDLLIFTQGSTWAMKYTGNDTTPFVLEKIDESRGCDATFSVITYLNRTSATSRRGLIISDGYRVERQDEEIPDFSFNQISGANFDLCFAGSVDADRDHYLIYPKQGSDTSDRILTTNYDEDNYSIYRLPLSCMGTYVSAFDTTWADLSVFPNWSTFSDAYGNWNSFAFATGSPFSIGGGHHGEIWRLSVTESEDNPVRIRNVTVIDSVTIEVTTDWNNYSLNTDDSEMGADYIFLSGMSGMEEINNQQFPITDVISNNVFRLDVSTAIVPATDFTPYVSNGICQRVIPFSALFKKFNPYVEIDKKVRCGWIYMYVDSTGTNLMRNIPVSAISNSDPCVVTTAVEHNLHTGDQVTFFGIGGTTELNGTYSFVTVIDNTSFSLNGVDSSAYGVYTSGGFASTSMPAKIEIDIITNDVNERTQSNTYGEQQYQGNCTNLTFEDGAKKWYKVFINQVGKFIQFRFRNRQAGATIKIQATMPGFQPVGRLI